MQTSPRQRRAGIPSLMLVIWFLVFAAVGSSATAQTPQPADSPATLGPILIEPVQNEQPLIEGPFLPEPDRFQYAEPDPQGTERLPQEMIDQALEAPPPNTGTGLKPNQMPPNYWVISFRECPQAGSPSTADQTTQYFYFGPQGPGTRRHPNDFYASLRPDVPVCIMVHGSMIDWKQMLIEGHATYEWLTRSAPGTPFQMVFMTWPSDRPLALLAPVDFSILGKRSAFNGLYLGRVISRMPSDMKISMIGHSHGARLIASGLNLMGGGSAYGYRLEQRTTEWPRMRVVLAAAALDHHWFDPNERYAQAFNSVESIVNLRNPNDFALRLYVFRLPLGAESMGRVGFTKRDQQLLGANSAKVRDIDLTSVLGTRHVWPWFYNQPELGRTLAPYLFFQHDLPHALAFKPNRRQLNDGSPRAIVTIPQQPVRFQSPTNPTVMRSQSPLRSIPYKTPPLDSRPVGRSR